MIGETLRDTHTERDNHKNCVFLLSAQFQLIFAFNEKKTAHIFIKRLDCSKSDDVLRLS